MTKVYFGEIEVCAFCRKAHERRGKNHKFKKAQKEGIKKCFGCKEYICQDCVNDSQVELKGHVMGQIGLDLCYDCLMIWKTEAGGPIIKKIWRKAVEQVIDEIGGAFYILKKEKEGAL